MVVQKRGYLVFGSDGDWSCAVVASSAREAKIMGYSTEMSLYYDWIDVRCRWQRGANVEGLPIGMVRNDILALRCGIYDWLDDSICDICGKHHCHVELINGKVVCFECIETIYGGEE